jgi:regulator of protease activity HflC (stomatin/prohibitin superfamily)
MKKITVNTNQVALIIRSGELKRVLTAGSHWVGFGAEVVVCDMAKPVPASLSLDVLLQHPDFAALVTIVDVADNEIVLQYLNRNLQKVLTAGRYAFWNGLSTYTFVRTSLEDYNIDATIDRNLLDKQPLAAFVRTYRVEASERAILFVDGKFSGILEGGNYAWWKNNISIQLLKTDMRQQALEMAGQEILTKDKAQLRINFTARYKFEDVVKALLENKEFEKQLYVVLQLALRTLVGRLSFDELMERKEALSQEVLALCAEDAAAMGVSLVDCGVKDIILPGDVKDIMNQVLVAEKRAQANIITRREETASTRSLLNTAKLMEDNAMLYKLKEMEYVEKIAEKINTISLSGSGQIVDQLKQIFVKQ